MKQSICTRVAALMACCATLCGGAVWGQDGVDEALAKIATYQFGQSREPLTAVADMVRDALDDPEQRKAMAAKLADLLGTDATHDCKQFCCRQLAICAGPENVPSIAALLADERTADMARYALEPIPGTEASQALIDALSKAGPVVKVGIINSLGERACPMAVSTITPLMTVDDVMVAEAAIAALGKIATPEAAQALKAAENHVQPHLKAVLEDAYLLCADRWLAQGKTDEAAAIYEAMYHPDRPQRIRVAAFQGLVTAKGGEGVDLVVQALVGDDAVLQGVATMLVRTMPGAEATTAIAGQLTKMASPGQVRLLSALADRGDKGAMDAVVRCVKRGDEAVQAAALEALAKLGDASTVPLLAEYATADKRSLQRAARGSLYTLRGEDIDRTILKAVREGAKDVRAELIAATVERNMMDAVPVLLECANDSAEEISAAALKALAELGGPDDMPALVACTVGAANDAQRAQAAKAVVAIGRKAAAAEGSASAVLAALEKAPGTPVRCALLGIVGELGDPNGLDVLRTAAQDRDKAVQDAAVRALSGWPTTAVLDDLFAIAKGSANQTHRVLALRNYVRLLALPSDRPAGETVAKYREAMALAPRTEEKRAVLAALANVHHPGALELAVPYLDNPDLQAEALAASLKVAEAICGAYPEEAGAAATKIAALAKDDETKQKAQAVLKTIEQLKGFITAWQVSPPYTQENKGGSELFDVVFPPEAGAADVAWQVMPVNLVPEKPWMMALDAFLGGENRVAYLRTTLVSPKAQQARLEMGSDDGLKVWLNGQVVSANSAARGCNPGDDKVDVQLKQGENPLLLKVTQGGGQWAAAVRLVAPDGGLLEGVKATLE